MTDFYGGGGEDSAYDMSFSTFTRINYWLWRSNEAKAKQDVHLWLEACKVLYMELDPHLERKAKGENNPRIKHEGMLKQAVELYRKHNQYNANYNSSPRKGAYQPPKDVYDFLFNWELELRRDLQRAGILLKKGEDVSAAIL